MKNTNEVNATVLEVSIDGDSLRRVLAAAISFSKGFAVSKKDEDKSYIAFKADETGLCIINRYYDKCTVHVKTPIEGGGIKVIKAGEFITTLKAATILSKRINGDALYTLKGTDNYLFAGVEDMSLHLPSKRKSELVSLPDAYAPIDTSENQITVNAEDLKDLLGKTLHAVADSTWARPVYKCVNFHAENGHLCLTATDGGSVATAACKCIGGSVNYNIYAKPLKAIKSLLGKNQTASLTFPDEGNYATIEITEFATKTSATDESASTFNLTLNVLLYTAEALPCIEPLIDDASTTPVFATVIKEELARAINLAAPFADEHQSVLLRLEQPDTLVISARNPDLGRATINIEAWKPSGAFKARFNIKYLLDLLNSFATKHEVMSFKIKGKICTKTVNRTPIKLLFTRNGVAAFKDESTFKEEQFCMIAAIRGTLTLSALPSQSESATTIEPITITA